MRSPRFTTRMSPPQSLKVANIIEEGRYGGPQARITTVAARLKEHGIETIVVFPRENSDVFDQKLADGGVRRRRLQLHRITRQKAHLLRFALFFLPDLLSLHRVIKQERVAVVHCNSARQMKGLIASRLAGAKVIWHLNDTEKLPFLLNVAFKIVARYFCDAFILSGERVKEFYAQHNDFDFNHARLRQTPATIIRPPVDCQTFNPAAVVDGANLLPKQNGRLSITTVGNVNPHKGLEYFIEMAHLLNQKHQDIDFFIVGAYLKSQQQYLDRLL
ncbi:MAG: glycosyltransferase, partial [Armatimonadota bacterium]|nr:glycosyltransferase [Armatimonadota bacterium]